MAKKAKSGLDEFREILRGWTSVTGIGATTALAIPILAALADVAPPWPKNVLGLTALAELVAVALTFQLWHDAPRRRVNRLMVSLAILLAVASVAYLAVSARFTAQIPTTKERVIKGFACTKDVLRKYPDCRFDEGAELESIEFRAEALWESWSIQSVRVALIAAWLVASCAFASLIAVFMVFQRRRRSVQGSP